MTGGGYARVDPDRMRRASQVFEDAAMAVRAAADQRNVVRSREGTHVWGSDETGQSFEQGYLKSSKGIFDSLDAVVELMDNLARGTAHTADQYRRTEQNNQQAVESMQRSTGEAAAPATSKRAAGRRASLRTAELRAPVSEREGASRESHEAPPAGQGQRGTGRVAELLEPVSEREGAPRESHEAPPAGQGQGATGRVAELLEPVSEREGASRESHETPPGQAAAPEARSVDHLAVPAEQRAVQAADLRDPVHRSARDVSPQQVPHEPRS